jgi:hypothetical protein
MAFWTKRASASFPDPFEFMGLYVATLAFEVLTLSSKHEKQFGTVAQRAPFMAARAHRQRPL